jgi:hypothetical protein
LTFTGVHFFQVQQGAIIVMGEMKFLDPDQEIQKVLLNAPRHPRLCRLA